MTGGPSSSWSPDFATVYSPLSSSLPTDRYLPSDFYRLTSRDSLAKVASHPGPERGDPSPGFTPDLLRDRDGDRPQPNHAIRPSLSSDSRIVSSHPGKVPLGQQRSVPSNAHHASPHPSAGRSEITTHPDPKSSSTRSGQSNRSSSTASSSSRSSLADGPLDVCILEQHSGIAQSFFESVHGEKAEQHQAQAKHQPQQRRRHHSPETSPVDAGTCECCCRCGRSSKVQLGRVVSRRSRSHSTLRTGISEIPPWEWEKRNEIDTGQRRRQSKHGHDHQQHHAGESPLERLPIEILDEIIVNLALDLPPSGYAPRNVDLIACLLASKTLHVATINVLYRQITIPHSTIFSKFLTHIAETPGLGTLVRRLDLSHFTSVGFGRSRQTNSEIQNLTSATLLKCLELTPWVQEVLLQENLDDDIDASFLDKMFYGLPKLRAVDFCACSSQPFVEAFSSNLTTLIQEPSLMLGIKRLSLHECFTLPSSAFEILLPRLPHLTHLDVSHTRITDSALSSIPDSAKLTHLNLGRCTKISGEGVVDFLTHHPGVRGLVYLNLSCDISRYRLLWEPDVDRLLPALPSTLRSLNLNGAHIHPHHVRHLIPLAKHLEELGLANANLSLADINALFRSPVDQSSTPSSPPPAPQATSLHYLDLTSISSITQSALFNTPPPSNILLTRDTLPLEVIELGDKVISSLRECRNTNKRLGWCVKELGRRGWYVREPVALETGHTAASGGNEKKAGRPAAPANAVAPAGAGAEARVAWKMGAMWWGMRKCPVAWGEVGGLYGHYMFKK